MQPNKYHVPSAMVATEKRFYDDADTVYHDIEAFKNRLRNKNDEFDKLMEYYERHRGVLDVYNRPINGPRAMRPNLGTRDETWYYLDGSGNKIWVRNIELDTSDARCGAYSEASATGADGGRIVVVKIPKTRANLNVMKDYRQKIAEYDASYRLPQSERTTRMRRTDENAMPPTWASAAEGPAAGVNVERYIATQKQLADDLNRVRPQLRPEYVWRPPATIEEAEARLLELKREAADIERSQMEAHRKQKQ